jgi:hypothetical protein
MLYIGLKTFMQIWASKWQTSGILPHPEPFAPLHHEKKLVMEWK